MGTEDSGGWVAKGIRYPNFRTWTTHSSAPFSSQVCQQADRQPPTGPSKGHGSYLPKFCFFGEEAEAEGDLEGDGGGVPEKRTLLGVRGELERPRLYPEEEGRGDLRGLLE